MTNDQIQMTNKIPITNDKSHSFVICAWSFVICMWSLVILVSPAFAEVAIETAVSRSVLPVGDQLVLDIIVANADGRVEQPRIGSIEGFTSYSQGHSQELSIING